MVRVTPVYQMVHSALGAFSGVRHRQTVASLSVQKIPLPMPILPPHSEREGSRIPATQQRWRQQQKFESQVHCQAWFVCRSCQPPFTEVNVIVFKFVHALVVPLNSLASATLRRSNPAHTAPAAKSQSSKSWTTLAKLPELMSFSKVELAKCPEPTL